MKYPHFGIGGSRGTYYHNLDVHGCYKMMPFILILVDGNNCELT